MARGHFPAGSSPGVHFKRCAAVEAQGSQLLKDDLDLAVKLPHVQQEGDVVAVMLNDVVVHVDQYSGREKKACVEWAGPLVCRASE